MPIGDRRQRAAGVDLEHGQVHRLVVLEDAGRVARAVGQVDLDPLDLVDDVVVGQDVAPAVEDHAGPHPADPGPLVLLGGERPAAGRGRLLLARDAHHARLRLRDRLATGVRRVRRRPTPGSTQPTSSARIIAAVQARVRPVASGAVARWSPLGGFWPTTRSESRRALSAWGRLARPNPRSRLDATPDVLWIGLLPTRLATDSPAHRPGFSPFPQDPQSLPRPNPGCTEETPAKSPKRKESLPVRSIAVRLTGPRVRR